MATMVISCNQKTADHDEHKGISQAAGLSDKNLIAKGFRSEALIQIREEDEMWYGKIDQKKLVDAIFEAVYDGRVTAYDFISDEPLSIEEVKEIESSIDTLYIENFETGELEMKVVEADLRRDEITKVFLKEDWYFDEENFRLDKKVLGLAFAKESYDSKGNLRGHEPLFIVYFDKNYPL